LQLQNELIERGNYAALAALAFPMVGLWMLGKSGMWWLRERKFANTRLVMSRASVAARRPAGGADRYCVRRAVR
jgi:hypothetical protein